MYEKTAEEIRPPKTFTGIQDIFGPAPFQNVLYQNSANDDHQSVAFQDNECCHKSTEKDFSLSDELREYVTCEQFHHLNKTKVSRKSIVRSTSTIFCDLDDIAKRHSFHCISQVYQSSNANILKAMRLPTCTGFQGKANAIVQECHTPQPPKILPKDSIEFQIKKRKKKFPHNDVLSSEIFLRDKELGKRLRYNLYYNTDAKHRQKFWSYAKYQTEYTKPASEKKSKKKDKGKRAEDPCPCQLFSYVCPCANDKSLMDLKNSKCSAFYDKVTSAAIMTETRKKTPHKDIAKENKSTGITKTELETIVAQQIANETTHKDNIPDSETFSNGSNKISKSKKLHKIICPKCKENIEATSFTEDDCSVKEESQSASKELPSTAAYNCSTSSRCTNNNKNKSGDGDVCLHEPRCELIPVCQILPNEDGYEVQKSTKKKTSNKSVPRVIRITKACRHHPPCTVVPSCQRANVLRNNCEFIPPCLHRPRCVNLPLCVPLPKNINYDDLMSKRATDDDESPECQHIPKCKLIALCQDSLMKNAEQHYNMCSRVTKTVDNGKFHTSYIISPKPTFSPNSRRPDKISSPESPCCSCNSNKSCQFNCPQPKLDSFDIRDFSDTSGVMYIRDVGCQFRNKQYSPIDSLTQCKISNTSLDYTDRYYTTTHTLRCEDKCINSTMEQDPLSTDSVLSVEIDSNCPSHGRGRYLKTQQCSGFVPKQAYVTAYADIALAPSEVINNLTNTKKESKRRDVATYPVKPRRSFFTGKCRLFSAKKSKMSNHFMNYLSKKVTAN